MRITPFIASACVASGLLVVVAHARQAPAVAPVTPATIDELADRYGRSDYVGFKQALRRLGNLNELVRRTRNFNYPNYPWLDDHHRQAAFYLELSAAILAREPQNTYVLNDLLPDAANLMYRAKDGTKDDEFQHRWVAAAMAMLEGLVSPSVEPIAQNVRAKVPNDPHAILASAILYDQLSSPMNRATVPAAAMTVAANAYQDAVKFPEVRSEATVRLAWLEHRRKNNAAALALLEGLDDKTADRDLAYFILLFRGHAHDALHETDAAEAAFRAAMARVPSAQSPRVALMMLLAKGPSRAEAEVLAAGIESARPDAFDPWWTYGQGEYRFFDTRIQQLREALK